MDTCNCHLFTDHCTLGYINVSESNPGPIPCDAIPIVPLITPAELEAMWVEYNKKTIATRNALVTELNSLLVQHTQEHGLEPFSVGWKKFNSLILIMQEAGYSVKIDSTCNVITISKK